MLKQYRWQPIKLEHPSGQAIRLEYYVTRELSARVQDPSSLSAALGSTGCLDKLFMWNKYTQLGNSVSAKFILFVLLHLVSTVNQKTLVKK